MQLSINYLTLEKLRLIGWVLFYPLSVVWTLVIVARRRFYPKNRRYHPRIPTLCIGNLDSGGSGKTPIVLALAQHYKNLQPAVVIRGYRSLERKTKVSALDSPLLYGDEAVFLAKRLRQEIYVGSKRVPLIKLIESKAESKLILLDDGFQHLQVHCFINLIVLNTYRPISELHCLPAGDFREPLSALDRADSVLFNDIQGPSFATWHNLMSRRFPQLPAYEIENKIEGFSDGSHLLSLNPDQRVGYFSAIGYPNKFKMNIEKYFSTAECLGVFDDHHPYTKNEIKSLVSAAKERGFKYLITTEKDLIKINEVYPERAKTILAVRIQPVLPSTLMEFLETRLRSFQEKL